MWEYPISKGGFSSLVRDDDVSSSGKWVLHVPVLEQDNTLWDNLINMTINSEFDAVKRTSSAFERGEGTGIICVYCRISSDWYVMGALSKLRGLGIEGELFYKSDKATRDGREEYLWNSGMFEDNEPRTDDDFEI